MSLAGSVMIVAGALLPWLTLFAGLKRYAGTTGMNGWILVGVGVLGIAGTVALLITRRNLVGTATGALGVAALLFTGWLLIGLRSLHSELAANPLMVARLGPGLFVSMAGAAILSTVLLFNAHRTGWVTRG